MQFFEYGREALSMATTPRTRNPADPLSAVEDALGLDDEAGDRAEPRPPRRSAESRAEQSRRSGELAQRQQGSRFPAPPRREGSRRAIDAAGPSPRRSEPPRPEDEIADDEERIAASLREDDRDQAPPPRPRAADRLRSRFAANDDRRSATSQLGQQRKPSRLIYPVAAILSAGWAVIVLAFVLTSGVFAQADVGTRIINIGLFLLLPV